MILSAAWAAFKSSKTVRITVAIVAGIATVALIAWRMLANAEARGAAKLVAKANREELKRIEEANRAEMDANSGSDRDKRLHDEHNRD